MTNDTALQLRETYRHGDLRRALVDAGVALARLGGPEAVVLREVTRRAGVVPNAAYRHFANRDDLVSAVRDAALAMLATAIERALATLDPTDMKRKAFARASLRAVVRGYLAFAASEPGLFRTAFAGGTPSPGPEDRPPGTPLGEANPFELLGRVLDRMVDADLMPPHRRPGAEYLVWSSVHGLAMLVDQAPLSRLDSTTRDDIGERLIRMMERGL
jgi:AcrR family transcriptional regulator